MNPVYANTTQWALPIADSTTCPLRSTIYKDSRWTGTCTNFTAGAGTGYVRLYADASGNPDRPLLERHLGRHRVLDDGERGAALCDRQAELLPAARTDPP